MVLRLDRFALTTNNITYAVYGEAMNYWAFFPVQSSGWGQLPVWGYADVVASDVGEIEPAGRARTSRGRWRRPDSVHPAVSK